MRPNGRILVGMNNMIYDYKESAYYWHEALMTMWIEAGYVVTHGDKCVVSLVEDKNVAHVAMTVDDCTCLASSE
jgi:hypothetical protein